MPRETNRYVKELIDAIWKIKQDAAQNSNKLYEETNKNINDFLIKLEFILEKDIKPIFVIFGNNVTFWNFLHDCLASSKPLKDGLTTVFQNNRQASDFNKGRVYIRYALVQHQLADTLQYALSQRQYISKWYKPSWPLYQDFEGKALINALYLLNEIEFVLKNFSDYSSKLNSDNINKQEPHPIYNTLENAPPLMSQFNSLTNSLSNIFTPTSMHSSSTSSPKINKHRYSHDMETFDNVSPSIFNVLRRNISTGVEKAHDVAASIPLEEDDGMNAFQRFYATRMSFEKENNLKLNESLKVSLSQVKFDSPGKNLNDTSTQTKTFLTNNVHSQTENNLSENMLKREGKNEVLNNHLDFALSHVDDNKNSHQNPTINKLAAYISLLRDISHNCTPLPSSVNNQLDTRIKEINELFTNVLSSFGVVDSRPSSSTFSHLHDMVGPDDMWKNLEDEMDENEGGQSGESYEENCNIEGINDRLKYQEKHVFKMERELLELKNMRDKDGTSFLSELQVLTEYLNDTEAECQALKKANEELNGRLVVESERSAQMQSQLNAVRANGYGKLVKYKTDLACALKDNQDLKQTLLKFIKEKDALWRFARNLEENNARLQATPPASPSLNNKPEGNYGSYLNPSSLYSTLWGSVPSWPAGDKSVQLANSHDREGTKERCQTCKSPFWILLRPYKCTSCAGHFCHYCARNWVKTRDLKPQPNHTPTTVFVDDNQQCRVCDACYQETFISPIHPVRSVRQKLLRGSVQSLPSSEASSNASSLVNSMALESGDSTSANFQVDEGTVDASKYPGEVHTQSADESKMNGKPKYFLLN